MSCFERIWRGNFYKMSVLGGMVFWKIVCVLKKILKKLSWKIWSVVMVFFPPGKSYAFLRNFEKALLEISMCSSTFWLSWKMCSWKMCSYTIFGSPKKFEELSFLLEHLKIWCVPEISFLAPGKKNRYFSSSAASDVWCFRITSTIKQKIL